MIERAIAVQTHGRYLVEPPSAPGPAPLLVGFHGYAESPELQLDRLRAIPGAEHWLCVSIQGLHRFYQRRTAEIASSWMTRQDRELAIADNIAFVARVVDAVGREWPHASNVVYAGFSQGVAMAYRAAAAAKPPVAGVISVGGDVPPELDATLLSRVPAALLCRGRTNLLYERSKSQNDLRRLQEAGTDVQADRVRWRTRVGDRCADDGVAVSPGAPTMIHVRTATVADARRLAELRWEFRSGRDAPTESRDVFVRRCIGWMRRELQEGNGWHAWAAVNDDGLIVGTVWVQTIKKIPNPASESELHAYLSNLYVTPSARGGIGVQLVQAAIAWAKINKIDRLILWPAHRSVSLYLRFGFSHAGDVMELQTWRPPSV